MVNDWPDELDADSTTFVSRVRYRMIAVHASMDDWERDFIAALERLERGKSVDKP